MASEQLFQLLPASCLHLRSISALPPLDIIQIEAPTMARKRREVAPTVIELKHPDRSGPTEGNLLQLAQERGLFDKAQQRQEENSRKRIAPARAAEDDGDSELSPTAERILDTILWSISLSMLHFTLDVLVQNQYAIEISWWQVAQRAAQAFLGNSILDSWPLATSQEFDADLCPCLPVFSMLFYVLHPHTSNPTVLPGLASRFQPAFRQAVFFISSTCAGCYLIHISNRHGYLAVMKQAPPLGCIWVWSVIELNLLPAVLSLGLAAVFVWQGGYDFK